MFTMQNMRGTAANCDRYFELPAGSFSFDDRLAGELKRLTDVQLMDTKVWHLFVELFRHPGVDDADSGWRCEYWGKMMRGACFTYRVTGDEALYAVLEETVREMLTAEDPLGRFSTYSVGAEFHGWDLWGRKYILLGMEYFAEICHDPALVSEIMTAMEHHVDYLIGKLGREEDGKINIAKATTHWDGLNSCSILEPVMFLYNCTGEARYLDFAEYILSFGGTASVNLFDLAYEDRMPVSSYHVTKAYEMISCFEGLAEYNKVKPTVRHTLALIRFANRVLAEEHTVIGCLGCNFESFDYAAREQFNESHHGIMQETCVTVTWMKFLWQLFRLTGEAKYMDAFETAAYNAMSAALKAELDPADNGGVLLPIHSYNPLRWEERYKQIGGRKDITPESVYGCCVCISSAGFALEGLCAACVDGGDNIAVNLYRNGTVKTPAMDFAMETRYPEEDTVRVKIGAVRKNVALSLRVPAWSKITLCRVVGADGAVEKYKATSGSYLRIAREWHEGDEIALTFDMNPRVITPQDYDAESLVTDRYAVARGPVVFAIDGVGDTEPAVDAIGELAFPVSAEQADVPCVQALCLPTADGSAILVDYASAGQLDGHKVSCWIQK